MRTFVLPPRLRFLDQPQIHKLGHGDLWRTGVGPRRGLGEEQGTGHQRDKLAIGNRLFHPTLPLLVTPPFLPETAAPAT